MSQLLDKDTVEIREVWNYNLKAEMTLIRNVVEDFPYVAMDTEFPGVVCNPVGTFLNTAELDYAKLKTNVNLLNVIQLGLTFSDVNGNLPTSGTDNNKYCVWQFNFREFDLTSDLYALESIALLRGAGIDYAKFNQDGIDSRDFGELLVSSGLVLDDDIHWLTFQGSSDIGYLLKIVTGQKLPETLSGYLEIMNVFFPRVYDVKVLLEFYFHLRGGLEGLARGLGVERVGVSHQAGSDSLLTLSTFHKLKESFSIESMAKHIGILYGLNFDNCQFRRN